VIDRWERVGEGKLIPVRAAGVYLGPRWLSVLDAAVLLEALIAPIQAGPDPMETAYQEAQEWAGEVKP
jgi:hypothetical protein